MIRVTVELVPKGNEKLKKQLGRMEIAHTFDNPDHPVLGNYTVRMVADRDGAVGAHQRRVVDFERLHWNVWALILNAIEAFDEDALLLEGKQLEA